MLFLGPIILKHPGNKRKEHILTSYTLFTQSENLLCILQFQLPSTRRQQRVEFRQNHIQERSLEKFWSPWSQLHSFSISMLPSVSWMVSCSKL